MKYSYHVSYNFQAKNNETGFGMSEYVGDCKMDTYEKLVELSKTIAERNNFKQVVILGITKLRT